MNVRIHRTRKPILVPKEILNANLPLSSIGLFILLAEVYRKDCYVLEQILAMDELKSETKENILSALEKLIENNLIIKEESADKVMWYYIHDLISFEI